MLGSTAFKFLNKDKEHETFGTLRDKKDIQKFFGNDQGYKNIISGVDALNLKTVIKLIDDLKPGIIINCIGIIKQLKQSKNHVLSIELNSLFPHKLASYIEGSGARLLHISTDCVFSGKRGNYIETDYSDAIDLYGKTKFLGEVVNYHNSVTLRTSIIGPELKGKVSLLEWFLSQEKMVKGYTNAIYSGLTTLELIKIIKNYIIPNPSIRGLYHISSNPISKYDLLKIISKTYNKDILIEPYDDFKSNKSLNSNLFLRETGYKVKTWEEMILELKKNTNV